VVGEKYLTVQETSEFAKISISTLNRLIKQNEIPSYKVGQRRLFDKNEVAEWVRGYRSDSRSKISNIKVNRRTYRKRWYDKHEELPLALEKLRTASKRECDNIVEGVKQIVTNRDPDFIDKVCKYFPLSPYRRRWYDKDPYLWLVVNSLRYADEQTIDEVVAFIKTTIS
jgi:excisionase family DNA binding protein